MSMPVTVVADDEDELFDPDDLKMPESPHHRRAVDAIGLAATSLLGPDFEIFRDMNWYPSDGGSDSEPPGGGGAVAPDIMVLPAGAFVAAPDLKPGEPVKSYRQDKTGGPPPAVIVEVPSDTDSYSSLRTKAHRYLALGVPVYIVAVDGSPIVDRLDPERPGIEDWLDKPIPELGGLRLTFEDGEVAVVLPDQIVASSDHEILSATKDRLVAAEARVAEHERRAAEAERRAAELEQRLREAGIDPDV